MHRFSVNRRPVARWLAVSLTVIALSACGDDSVPPGGDVDSSMPAADLGPADRDLGRPRDTGPDEDDLGSSHDDSGADGSAGDGGRPDFDSGPTDPDGGAVMDMGAPPPTDAGPSPVDADTGPCASEGMSRIVPCGRCGLASQSCTGGRWSAPTECMDEQECLVGQVERESVMCGMRSRICDDSCHWRPWSAISGDGDCETGSTERVTDGCMAGLTRERRCDDECHWGAATGVCAGECDRPAMPSRTGADPVCIPAGSFILGSLEVLNAQPVRTITLSSFWLDRYPVTRERFDACLADGACEPLHPTEQAFYDTLTAGDLAIYATDGAAEFCAWDGGVLPSEFQWEKAARGPDPDARRHPWGDADGGCDEHPWIGCDPLAVSLADFPANVSPYGVRLLAIANEPTRTASETTYEELPEVDPEGGPITRSRRYRGYWWRPDTMTRIPPTVSVRQTASRAYIRCAY